MGYCTGVWGYGSEHYRCQSNSRAKSFSCGASSCNPDCRKLYYVQPGDSLWSIGQRFGINYVTLAQVNGIHPNQPLAVGTRLYIPQPPKTRAQTLAYLEPRGTSVSEALLNQAREAGPYLTYLALFSYEARRDGTLQRPPSQGVTQIANDTGASMAMVISNLENFSFSGELARDIFQKYGCSRFVI